MARPVLLPSGKHVAVRVGSPSGRTRLAVLSVDPPRTAAIVAGFDDTNIGAVQWVSDDRRVFSVADSHQAWDHWSAPGLTRSTAMARICAAWCNAAGPCWPNSARCGRPETRVAFWQQEDAFLAWHLSPR